MAGLHKSEIQNPVLNWVDTRLPVFTMMQKEYGVFPTPKNFNYFWNFRRAGDDQSGDHDCHRGVPGDELQSQHRRRVRQRRAHRART